MDIDLKGTCNRKDYTIESRLNDLYIKIATYVTWNCLWWHLTLFNSYLANPCHGALPCVKDLYMITVLELYTCIHTVAETSYFGGFPVKQNKEHMMLPMFSQSWAAPNFYINFIYLALTLLSILLQRCSCCFCLNTYAYTYYSCVFTM